MIYVARGEASGRIKIGASVKPANRIRAFIGQYGERFRLLGTLRASYVEEEMVHHLLRPFHPEWGSKPCRRWTEIYPASAVIAAIDAYFTDREAAWARAITK